MNPLDNPFAPGAGTPPPEIAGRDALLGSIHVAAERIRWLLAARSVLLLGLRGVGKTVLLDRVHDRTLADGFATMPWRNLAPDHIARERSPGFSTGR